MHIEERIRRVADTDVEAPEVRMEEWVDRREVTAPEAEVITIEDIGDESEF